jgi:hypothetical protein
MKTEYAEKQRIPFRSFCVKDAEYKIRPNHEVSWRRRRV